MLPCFGSVCTILCGEISLFFTLISSIAASLDDAEFCRKGTQMALIFFYLNFVFMFVFELSILRDSFDWYALPVTTTHLSKYAYPKHLFRILKWLLILLSLSIIVHTMSIPQSTMRLTDIGCPPQSSLLPSHSLSSQLLVVWAWLNALVFFLVLWLLLAMYTYKCFQFKTQYKLSMLYNQDIANLSSRHLSKQHVHPVEITIDNIHDYSTNVKQIYYVLQKVSLLMVFIELTAFLSLMLVLLTWMSEWSRLSTYLPFTMTVFQILINSYSVTLMVDDNDTLFQVFAYRFHCCFGCLFKHIYDIMDEQRENDIINDKHIELAIE